MAASPLVSGLLRATCCWSRAQRFRARSAGPTLNCFRAGQAASGCHWSTCERSGPKVVAGGRLSAAQSITERCEATVHRRQPSENGRSALVFRKLAESVATVHQERERERERQISATDRAAASSVLGKVNRMVRAIVCRRCRIARFNRRSLREAKPSHFNARKRQVSPNGNQNGVEWKLN